MPYPSREELVGKYCRDTFNELHSLKRDTDEECDGGYAALTEMTSRCVFNNLSDEIAVPTLQFYLRCEPTPQEWTEDQLLSELKETRNALEARRIRDAGRHIIIHPPECEVIDQTCDALRGAENLYQRGNALCRITRSTRPPVGVQRPSGSPQIEVLTDAALHETLSRCGNFFRFKKDNDIAPTVIPGWVPKMVAARPEWPVPPLEGIIDAPVLRPDGSILSKMGYDSATGLYLNSYLDLPEVSLEEAKELLEYVVIDFPFKDDAHKSAFFAALLTPFARYAYRGNSPMFLFDGNSPGVGKTFQGDIIGMVFGGRPLSRFDMPATNDEWRKKITTFAMAGDPVVMIDNIDAPLDSSALDAAITAQVWRDRILGKTQQVEVPLNWVLIGNGVNIRPGGTIYRRVVVSRLETPLEHPENRTDFKEPDLLGFVEANRHKIIAAVLKILTNYYEAGRPRQTLAGFGSFNEWSDLVRSAIVHAGWPDPCSTREEFAEASDPNAELHRALIVGWKEADPDGFGLTVKDAMEKRFEFPSLEAAISMIPASGDLATLLGRRLGGFRHKPSGGLCFRDAGTRHNAKVWKVCPVGQAA